MKTAYFIFALTLLFITSCKKEPDPCEAIRNEPGGFIVEEIAATDKGIEAKDTVTENCLIRFTSRRTYDSYTWLVGTEAEPRTGKSISVVFPENTNISVRLIGKRAPTPCIPGDDGIDTFVQKLVTVPWQSSPVMGYWQGYLTSNPSDTFTVQFTLQPKVMDCDVTGLPIMLNLPENSTPKDPAKVKYCMPMFYPRYNGLEFELQNWDMGWTRRNGFGYFRNGRNELHVEFEGKNDFQDWHQLHFIGKKVK